MVACEQAHQGTLAVECEKEGELATRSPEFANLHKKKVYVKCWLAETTLVMTTLPLVRVFQCLVTLLALDSTLRWLAEIWQLSRWGACSCRLQIWWYQSKYLHKVRMMVKQSTGLQLSSKSHFVLFFNSIKFVNTSKVWKIPLPLQSIHFQ